MGKPKKFKHPKNVRVDVEGPVGLFSGAGELTLSKVLGFTCPQPEDFGDYLQWQRDRKLNQGPEFYQGTMRYRLNLHCHDMYVQANYNPEGELIIHGYFIQDH